MDVPREQGHASKTTRVYAVRGENFTWVEELQRIMQKEDVRLVLAEID